MGRAAARFFGCWYEVSLSVSKLDFVGESSEDSYYAEVSPMRRSSLNEERGKS